MRRFAFLLSAVLAVLLVAATPVSLNPWVRAARPGLGTPAPAGPAEMLTLTVESGSITLADHSVLLQGDPAPAAFSAPAGSDAHPLAAATLTVDARATVSTPVARNANDPSAKIALNGLLTAPRAEVHRDAAPSLHDPSNRSGAASATNVTLEAVESSVQAAQPVTSTAPTDPKNIPVLIVHGTWSNTGEVQPLKDSLEAQGFSVYSYNYGRTSFSLVGLLVPSAGGMQDIHESVEQLAVEIAKVKAETGSDQINLVGHSQGGLLIKDYLAHNSDPGVQRVVDLGASNHGTEFGGGAITLLKQYAPNVVDPLNAVFGKKTVEYLTSGKFLMDVIHLFPAPLQPLVRWGAERVIDVVLGVAPEQQLVGSAYIDALNKTPDTKPGVNYLVIGTKDDEYVTPYQSTYLKAVPGSEVHNFEVHSLPGVNADDVVSHDGLLSNPSVAKVVGDFLTSTAPALSPDTGRTITVDGGTTTEERVSTTATDSTPTQIATTQTTAPDPTSGTKSFPTTDIPVADRSAEAAITKPSTDVASGEPNADRSTALPEASPSAGTVATNTDPNADGRTKPGIAKSSAGANTVGADRDTERPAASTEATHGSGGEKSASESRNTNGADVSSADIGMSARTPDRSAS